METILSGWLIKSPPERRPWNIIKQHWKKRFFVLCQLFTSSHKNDRLQLALEYFDSENKCCKKGRIDLENCDDIQSGLRCPPHENVFSMRTKYRGQLRVYYLAAESFEEMDRWVQSLCTVLNHRPASQCLRQMPVMSGYDLVSYSSERSRRGRDPFSSRRASFHCPRTSHRPPGSREQIRNNSSDVGLCSNDTQSSFLDSVSSFNFPPSKPSSDCYIPLGECYSGPRREKLTTASDEDFFSVGRYGSLRRRDRATPSTFDRSVAKHARESRSYSNLSADYFKTPSNARRDRPPRRPQAAGRPPTISGTRPRAAQPPVRTANSSRLAVPGKMHTTKTVFLNNSFASSRPFLESERNPYMNSLWERNFRTVPLHPRQSFEAQRNPRWYERRHDVQLPMKNYNRSFESDSSCDEGDDETSPSTFNEYPSSYMNNSRRQPVVHYRHPPPSRPHHQPPRHHASLHYLDLDLDSCCLDDSDRNEARKPVENQQPLHGRTRRASRSARDVTQYCQIDFCKTKGLQETRIDVESERKNSDRSVENSAPTSFF